MLISSFPVITVADLFRGDMQLASPPNIYFALKTILDDPNKSAKDAAFVIENDAALTARLLKIVNSAYFGFPAQIGSIAKAISLVGTRELQNLVLATVIIERFSNLPGQTFSVHDFWARNLRCALLSREFDAQLGKKYADSAFVCGLLHNIGKLLFYRRIPALAREVDLLLQSKLPADAMNEVLIEQRVLGFDHFQAGAELCKFWQLPEVIVESIRLHALPDYISPYSDIAAIVRLSNCYARIDQCHDKDIIYHVNLSPEQISLVIDKTNDEFEAIFKIFYPPLSFKASNK
ncbi:MAG: HDOD domain-containing protein [Methylomonas sp.]